MAILPSEITDEMVNAAVYGGNTHERLAVLLNLPAVRQLVAEATKREHAAMMAALPSWDDLSDLDKGAALMFLAKVENECYEYAVENYPVKYIEDPRLTALSVLDACAYTEKFEDLIEDMDGGEHERLYNLALNHERGNR